MSNNIINRLLNSKDRLTMVKDKKLLKKESKLIEVIYYEK